MSSVYAMISKHDIPGTDGNRFDKGDIISYHDRDSYFGSKIIFNTKFRIVEVVGISLEAAEALTLPIIVYEDAQTSYELKKRLLTVDVDALTDYQKVPASEFQNYISLKEISSEQQNSNVVV